MTLKNIERKDLVNAVLASRDEIDPELDTELLEAIVDAEMESAGDGDTAMRSIEAALIAAIDRGVGYVKGADSAEANNDEVNGEGGGEEDRAQC